MVGLNNLKNDATSWAVAGNLRCGGVIFYGPSGTGKSSGARAIAKDMLGTRFDANYHEFNGSDDRGIAFVRERLKPLAEQKATASNYKVILLDEADGLTRDSQDALRQIIERTSTHTMWILACNHIGKISPALRSRLPAYNFPALTVDEADSFLSVVIHEEGFPTKWLDSVPHLILKHRGDLRACLKTLQVCNPEDEFGLEQLMHDDLMAIDDLYGAINNKDWADTLRLVELVDKLGVSREEIIDALHRGILDAYKDEHSDALHTLSHLCVLGQWAARSAGWTAGNFLFLHSIVGDFQKRG
tara:strand:- start:760 stop:1662 length:903 start_codon:yes stop_codon:yes gene_type:complete